MLSSSGIIDMLDTDPNSTLPPAVQQYQQDDFFQLGLLILALACGTPAIINPEQQAQSLAYVSRQYSEDLIVLLQYVVLSSVFRVQVFLWSSVDACHLSVATTATAYTAQLYVQHGAHQVCGWAHANDWCPLLLRARHAHPVWLFDGRCVSLASPCTCHR
jgi:hypothetical protein